MLLPYANQEWLYQLPHSMIIGMNTCNYLRQNNKPCVYTDKCKTLLKCHLNLSSRPMIEPQCKKAKDVLQIERPEKNLNAFILVYNMEVGCIINTSICSIIDGCVKSEKQPARSIYKEEINLQLSNMDTCDNLEYHTTEVRQGYENWQIRLGHEQTSILFSRSVQVRICPVLDSVKVQQVIFVLLSELWLFWRFLYAYISFNYWPILPLQWRVLLLHPSRLPTVYFQQIFRENSFPASTSSRLQTGL